MTEQAPSGAVVRAARPDELLAIWELLVAAFGERVRERMRTQLFEDQGHHPDQSRVAELDGALASYVRVSSRPINYGGAVLPMAGVGGVSTHPAHQGRGLSSAVLRDCIAYMRGQGYPLSVLFTGIPGFYARLGWVPFPQWSWRAPLTHHAGDGPPAGWESLAHVRPFEDQRDLDPVQEVYTAYNTPRSFSVARHPAYWADGHTRHLGILPTLVAEQQGRVVAYASARQRDRAYSVYEAACLPGHERAFSALAVAIMAQARAAGATDIEANLGLGHGLTAALQEASGSPGTWTGDHYAMLLLLDLPGLLRAALPTLQSRLTARPRLHGKRASYGLRVAGQYARLAVRHGEVLADTKPARRALNLPDDLFWRLFFGAASLHTLIEELATRSDTQLSAEDVAMLDALFPPQRPVYWWPDHF